MARDGAGRLPPDEPGLDSGRVPVPDRAMTDEGYDPERTMRVLAGFPRRKRPEGHEVPNDVADDMARLYREHGALQALAEDDLSLLPAGMTMDGARRLRAEIAGDLAPPGPEDDPS